MDANSRQEYLVTEVMTAPPQKLQLMLIDAAIRFAVKAKEQWRTGENAEAGEAVLRCQQIVTEIMAGIRPDADRALAGKISAIYAFVFRCLVAAHLRSDAGQLDEAISVLQVERETWQTLCTRLADAPPPAAADSPLARTGFSLQA
ncbi:MAG: flagellar export chaperone FliS [Pirellulales bacterium]